MKVVCDNCRAVYKVPDDKLTKAVNKATCRNCGHRMLIPRPKPNADPEERTLVTAVPPTPVGAPPRAAEPVGGRSSDDLRVPTPMMSSRTEGPRMDAGRSEPSWNEPAPARAIDQTQPGPEEDFDGPDTKLAVSPGEQDTAREAAREARGRGGPSMPPGSLPPGRSPPIKRSPTPTPAPPPGALSHSPAAISPSASREMPLPSSAGLPPGRKLPQSPSLSQSTPQPISREHRDPRDTGTPRPAPPARSAPPPRSGAYPAMALHDPAGDLNWALLGTGTALIGGFLLAFLSIWNHPLVMWFGLAMTFGGGLLTFMVLLTGARGRRPAKTLLSVLFGGIFAVVTSTMMVATKWGAERVIDAYDISFSDVGLRSGTSVPSGSSLAANVAVPPAPLPAPAPSEPQPAPPPAEPAPSQGRVQPPAPPPRPAPQPPPQPPGRTTAPPPAPQPVVPQPVVAAPPPAPVPTPPPAPVPTPKPTVGMETVPMEVIFVMLSNNLEVKKCFVPLMKAGTLPPRIDLKFNIMPDGRATNAMVLQSDYRGSSLEACLVRAVTGISFPPTSGSGTAITFPFVLQ